MSQPPLSAFGDFTEQAASYALARPGYPGDIIDRLVHACALKTGDPVADLGAGTGLLTQMLAERGLQVTAIEPNRAMRDAAPRIPGVTWIDATFENTGLPASSQRWVVAAQSFHWARYDQALPELRRILQPGGRFTVIRNGRRWKECATLAWTRAAAQRHIGEYDQPRRDWKSILVSTRDFTDARTDDSNHVVRMSKQRYLDFVKSHNRLTVTAGPARLAAFLDELQQYLASLPDAPIDVPFWCRSITVTRRG